MGVGGLQADLEAMLTQHVDVITEPGLKARIRERLLAEAVPLLEIQG